MATATTSTNATALINALSVWSEATESDNARDLNAGIARMTAVHGVVMPLFQAEEQTHLAAGNATYKVETFHGFLKATFKGEGKDFGYTVPEIQAILDFELHSDENKATFVLWTVEDAKLRKGKVGRDVKVKAANFDNYQDWLRTTKVRVLNATTKKYEVVDRWTPGGKETAKAKADRLRREAVRAAERSKVLSDASTSKLFGDMTGKALVEAVAKHLHEAQRIFDTLKSEMLATGDDGKPVDDEAAKAWADGVKAYNKAKSA